MIIDFRVRPPYKSFMHGILYEKQPEHPDPLSQIWSDIDKDPAVSAQEHSFKLFIEEMEASGIRVAVAVRYSGATRPGSSVITATKISV